MKILVTYHIMISFKCECQNWTIQQWGSLDCIYQHIQSLDEKDLANHCFRSKKDSNNTLFCNSNMCEVIGSRFRYDGNTAPHKHINNSRTAYDLSIYFEKHTNALSKLYKNEWLYMYLSKYLPKDLITLIINYD